MAKSKSLAQVKTGYVVNSTGNLAKINIVGHIGWWKTSGERFIELVDELIAAGITDVEGYINSPGGSMDDANEIGNQISRFSGEKACRLGSLCASAGTTISTYFDHDKIVASKNTQYMIHDPIMRPIITRLKDFKSSEQLYTNLRNDAIRNYEGVTRSNQGENAPSLKEIDQMMEDVTWMDAKKAKAKGFVSSVDGDSDDFIPEDSDATLRQIYADLNEQSSNEFAIPDTINAFITTSPDMDDNPNNQSKNSRNIMDENKFKNKLIMAFGLKSVTQESTIADVLNAAIVENKRVIGLWNSLSTKLSLSVQGDPDAIINAIDVLINEKDQKLELLAADKKVDDEKKLKAVLDIAENDQQKINGDGRKQLEAMAEKSGIESVMTLLGTMPSRKKLADGLEDDSTNGGQSLEQAVYSRLAAMDEKPQ